MQYLCPMLPIDHSTHGPCKERIPMQEIRTWTDPHGYHRHLTILQSNSNAVRIIVTNNRAAHKPLGNHFNDVSPLVAAVVGQPSSIGARRVMFQSSKCDIEKDSICVILKKIQQHVSTTFHSIVRLFGTAMINR